MDKSIHEEHLFQPLQTNNEQIKIAVTFLTGYNGIFKVTNSYNKFYFEEIITDADDFIQITIQPGACEIEYPFTIKPIFSTLGSIIEKSTQGPIISFVFIDSIGSLLGFHETILYKEYNLSSTPADILSSDNIFLECNLAQGMIFGAKKSGVIHNFTMDVDPGNKYIEKFRGGVQWYMMDSKDFISSISFKLKNENGNLVSFDGQSITFTLSVKEV